MNATRLINVSNRLPIIVEKEGQELRVQRSPGGLASAVEAMWRGRAGIWIGWSGSEDDPRLGEFSRRLPKRQYQMRNVALTAEEISKFYSGLRTRLSGRCSMTCRRRAILIPPTGKRTSRSMENSPRRWQKWRVRKRCGVGARLSPDAGGETSAAARCAKPDGLLPSYSVSCAGCF